jgi:hypothetical protein
VIRVQLVVPVSLLPTRSRVQYCTVEDSRGFSEFAANLKLCTELHSKGQHVVSMSLLPTRSRV